MTCTYSRQAQLCKAAVKQHFSRRLPVLQSLGKSLLDNKGNGVMCFPFPVAITKDLWNFKPIFQDSITKIKLSFLICFLHNWQPSRQLRPKDQQKLHKSSFGKWNDKASTFQSTMSLSNFWSITTTDPFTTAEKLS